MAKKWQRVEEGIIQYLKDWWGQDFRRQRVVVGPDGEELELEFDAVSEDMQVFAEVKSMSRPQHAREMQLALDDIRKLQAVRASRKLLFLVDPLFYQVFCRKHQKDLISWKRQGIEIVSPFELVGYLEGLELPGGAEPTSSEAGE